MRPISKVLSVLAVCAALAGCKLQPYRTFERPDGLYRIEVWRQFQVFAMPGQAGDAPGTVRLVDSQRNTLAEARVEMVELVDAVDWSGGHARIRLIVDWDLAAISPPE